ncbi:hypothetical protein ACF0H5_008349 [Mactra antiquata]
MTRSTSSVWGSANSHERFDKRFLSDDSSAIESYVSLELKSKSGPSALIKGSRDVVCKTPAEFKANKLNRKEQTKLENVTFQFIKEKEIAQRKFNQSERMIRAKSAKIFSRMKTLESSTMVSSRPKSYSYENTMRGRRAQTKSPDGESGCVMCETIQKIISEFEKYSGRRTEKETDSSQHTTCLFSDVQVRAFVHVLETKYLSKSPELSNVFRDSGISSASKITKGGSKLSQEELSNSIARRKVELRIQKFCKDLERYNKEHTLIPKEVQESVERIRLQNAVVIAKCHQDKHNKIKKEVEALLGLQEEL